MLESKESDINDLEILLKDKENTIVQQKKELEEKNL